MHVSKPNRQTDGKIFKEKMLINFASIKALQFLSQQMGDRVYKILDGELIFSSKSPSSHNL